jgi:selenide,water dikinase
LTNTGVVEGDALILTKPIGSGVLFNANRSKKLPWRELEQVLPMIATLNKKSLEIATTFDVHACTDVTGFAMMGHTLEMAKASGVQINLSYSELPFYPNALEMYQKGETTGSNADNRKLVEGFFKIRADLTREQEELLFDPQTSGGLLLSVPSSQTDDLIKELKGAGVNAASQVGEVVSNGKPSITVV